MKQQKQIKKESRISRKDFSEDGLKRGKPSKNKVKYNHKNHWLDEDEVVPIKLKKKKPPIKK